MTISKKVILIPAIFIFLANFMSPVILRSAGVMRVHPLTLQLANQDPDQQVQVILQKADASETAERLVIALGGEITRDLHLIRSFSAVIAAGNIPVLAGSSSVAWISLDAPVLESRSGSCRECIHTSDLINAYTRSVGADRLWNEAPFLQGQGISVAIVDSGMNLEHPDLANGNLREIAAVSTNVNARRPNDKYGHGTHIAGIIGGDGDASKGARLGMAPEVSFINVKVSDDNGAGTTSDVVAGLQWIYENREKFTIRVVNVSLNSSIPESYDLSPLNAALEILWFNGITVVTSVGNNGSTGSGVLYPPGNDPFLITVGAVDDRGTPSIDDDILASFSAYGTTLEGFAKPDLVAPGTNIVSALASNTTRLALSHPDHIVDGISGRDEYYFRMSGTSMAAAVTTGAVILLLQDEPELTPDQVKHRLMATARPFAGPVPGSTGAGYLDAYAAVKGTTIDSANTGITASRLLWTGSEPNQWDSMAWNSVSWGSVSWGSVAWGSVAWGSVAWGSDYWGP